MSAYNTTAEFYVGDDGKIHYGPAEENYKEFLATMNQWYKEGLLDPDMPTAQLDQVSAKMTSGASGASLGWIGSRMGVWTTAAKETDPNYDLEAAPVPTLNKGETAKMGPMDNVVVNNGGAAITTRCKDIEAAARLLDWALPFPASYNIPKGKSIQNLCTIYSWLINFMAIIVHY